MNNLIRINAFGSALNDGLFFPLNGPLCWPNIDITPDTLNWITANATLPDGPWVNAVVQVTGISNPIELFYTYLAGSVPTDVYVKVSSTSFNTGDYGLGGADWVLWNGGSVNSKSVLPNQYFGIAVDSIGGSGTLRIFNFTDSNKLLDTLPYAVLTLE
jgi:hypothetical protein